MLLARIAAAENRGMPPVRKLENPELRFRVHQPEAENMLVEMRQFTAAACSRAIPPKASDLHASAAAVKGSARKPPGNILCREERHVRRPRATELAHLRAPATLAELTPRPPAKSAICYWWRS